MKEAKAVAAPLVVGGLKQNQEGGGVDLVGQGISKISDN